MSVLTYNRSITLRHSRALIRPRSDSVVTTHPLPHVGVSVWEGIHHGVLLSCTLVRDVCVCPCTYICAVQLERMRENERLRDEERARVEKERAAALAVEEAERRRADALSMARVLSELRFESERARSKVPESPTTSSRSVLRSTDG